MSPKKQIFPNILKGCTWTEKVPEDAIGKTVVVTYTNGQWFASVRFVQPINQVVTKELSIVALDPGVRTFQTAFSVEDAISYGDQFANDKLVPLMSELDRLLSERDKLHNEDRSLQWVKNRLEKS
ncbi:hypothetical protein BGP_1227 [Beggiatoa sp. PS]|nr:hypothetical protein BGP_1227 [Beggiatoa sp. PS]